MAETRQSRWRRRAATVPTMLAATAVGLIGLPVLVPLAILADVVRLRFKLPTLRVYLFLLQYACNDSAEILLAPVYWALAGFGSRLDSPASIGRHTRLQTWSLDLLIKRADTLLGIDIHFDHEDLARIHPGPVIVLSRHISLFDASLPGVICAAAGLPVRGVIMAELLADPGFDLIYGRLGSVFIPRDNGPEARAEIRRMADSAGPDAALVIFPEGRLFRRSVRDRLMAKIETGDPARAQRLAGLSRMLPPRPGGVQALLGAVPEADVVVVHHRGLDRFRKMTDVVAQVPAHQTITVEVERIPRTTIPEDPDEQVVWLDELWMRMDSELAALPDQT